MAGERRSTEHDGSRPVLGAALLLLAGLTAAVSPAAAQPTVIATAEGQVGAAPGADDQVVGARFESIRGQAGDILLGGIFSFGGALPPPPEAQFFTDALHGTPNPSSVGSFTGTFNQVFDVPPGSARSRSSDDDSDFVAFSFAVDGVLPETMTVRLVTFDETGSQRADVSIGNIGTVRDPFFNETSVAVDNQGRTTVVYTEVTQTTPVFTTAVRARRFDAGGNPIGGEITVATNRADSEVALLDPSGNRLIIATTDFGAIRGNILDVSGPVPVVLPEFPISTTPPVFAHFNPAVAADSSTGAFVVAWEDVTAVIGDPVNIRARRFDAMGNPVGDDFIVNTTTADAQGQPRVAVNPDATVIVWAGDGLAPGDQLDVFAQPYDAAGNPIGVEIRVNTGTTDDQDQPTVRFLPEPDAQGRTQFGVVWRDVESAFDNGPARGTGQSYKCFAINEDPVEIFADGFESGDTSSWSTVKP